MADLNEMAVFVKVAEELSITRAARALNLPKSTVSRRLTRLEERLGVRLIHRSTRNLNLTEVGVAFYERCARLIAEADEAEMAISELHQIPRGHLRITAPSLFAVAFLRPIVADFMEQYQDVTIELMLSSRVVNVIEEGFDLAIRVGRLEDSTLVARKLGPTAMGIYASPAYLERWGEPTDPKELTQHLCLILGSGIPQADWRLESPHHEPVTVNVQGRLVVNDLHFLRDAVIAGMGIGQIPSFMSYKQIQEGSLHHILPHWQPPQNAIYAIYPSKRFLSAKVRAFLEFLTERLSPTPPWLLPTPPHNGVAPPHQNANDKPL